MRGVIRALPLPAAVAILGAMLPALAPRDGGDGGPSPVDFNRDVRPILAETCLICHGPDAEFREADLRLDVKASVLADRGGYAAVVPGDAEKSELYLRISDARDGMPPKDAPKHLTPDEIALLKRWIDEGAVWHEHWAYVAPVRAPLPTVGEEGWARDPLDRWVLARLEREGLAPAAAASPAALLRRVSLDLTGLPPAVDELDAFLADRAADPDGAYERAVDRLLASPRYGEQMTRTWLDAARYGDTHGYHLDNVRSLWRWRDWVIDAFNRNLPFDAFTVDQIAGDRLPDPTLDQLIATGFNRCNPTTGEGGLIDEEYLVKYAVDRTSTMATVFLGSTLGCAVCHDHKFDPFSQAEFYGLFAYFHSFAEEASDENALAPPPAIAAPTREQQERLSALDAGIADVEARLRAPVPALDPLQRGWEAERAGDLGVRWTPLVPRAAASREGAVLTVLADASVLASGPNPATDAYTLELAVDADVVSAIHLEALPHPSFANGGVGRATNANIVLTGITVDLGAADALAPLDFRRVPLASAYADYSQPDWNVAGALDAGDAATGWGVHEDETTPHQATFVLAEPLDLSGLDGPATLRVVLRFDSVHAQHTLGRFRLSASTVAVPPTRVYPWYAVGPFFGPDADTVFATDFGPELGLELSATYDDGRGGEVAWVARPEYADGAPHEFAGDNAAVYLARTIHAPTARKMEIALGSDDALKVWLNDWPVLENNARRPLAADQDRVVLDLPAGDSRLLLKIVNAAGGFGFRHRVVREELFDVPFELARALLAPPAARDEAQRDALRRAFRSELWDDWIPLQAERQALADARAQLEAEIPMTMIARDRDEPRPTYVLRRGEYDHPGPEVAAGVPAVLPPLALAPGAPNDRLALARWLVAPEQPLTPRVTVNRIWGQMFGRGLVSTPEDFGTRGAFPSHPELLDMLSVDFVESGWDVKALVRRLVTSATYRQDSAVTPAALARDPRNALLGRGTRHRLDAEQVRDLALFVSGLLVEEIGGPSVKPYQPPGLWEVVGYTASNTANFTQDSGDALYRRSMYTFWKRTSPPPSMALFDAPNREACTVQRSRTNTPLQALALLNDVQFVEAARAFAARLLRERESDEARLAQGFRAVTGRFADADELAILAATLAGHRAAFAADPAGARALLAVGDSPPAGGVDAAELAAWTLLANLLLNLDEALTRG
jgi:hypothetical protein